MRRGKGALAKLGSVGSLASSSPRRSGLCSRRVQYVKMTPERGSLPGGFPRGSDREIIHTISAEVARGQCRAKAVIGLIGAETSLMQPLPRDQDLRAAEVPNADS